MNEAMQLKLIEKQARKPGLRGKIDAKCVECIYDPAQEGGWRQQVEKCASASCPLYSVRTRSCSAEVGGNSLQLELV